ncbi:hypothetical protein BT67DRAFT_459307 [Trichocladium antarcticum]|uniref:Uncharacterized protein n=1 Tax=Trichocladium antarcticum TaxID=1450529 RepID=A0AAN6ZGK3_9PEZI|nr:hypothetical protein BT67DRAFT_459307 [Trichocladium antarcticum]
MHDNRTHPLLQQLPLTVSPFINLPTATTLPYTYRPMPSTLPPSSISISTTTNPPSSTSTTTTTAAAAAAAENKPKYVISPSGHAAHPDEILASCRALHAHVAQLQGRADAELRAVEARIRARELAEKRRVAPGWLDSEARLLEPERGVAVEGKGGYGLGYGYGFGGRDGYAQNGHGPGGASEMAVPDEGGALDRAFGSIQLGGES